MTAVSIRAYDAARDVNDLRACFIALQDHEHALYPEAPRGEAIVDAYLAWMFGRVARYNGVVLVAEFEKRFAGFASVLARMPRTDPDDADAEHAFLSELSVMPDVRGQGVGAALIAACEDFARERGAAVMRVTVVAENEGAQRLYLRSGFEPAQLMLQKRLDS